MWFVAPVEGINSLFDRILVRGQQLRKVQLGSQKGALKKEGAASASEEMYLTDEIGYASLQIVGSICNLYANIMPMSKLWL